MVTDLKKKAELSGNDFLPMVLKLDELLAHLRGVREMAGRLTTLKDTLPPRGSGGSQRQCAAAHGARVPKGGAEVGEDLSPTLHALAERLAKDHHKTLQASR